VTGNPNDFASDYFYGPRTKVYGSAGEGISAGIGYSWSTAFGETVTATSIQVSIGLSAWFIQEATIRGH